MHANDFRTDRHGVVSELRDGGYSDDMTLAAIAGKMLVMSCLLSLKCFFSYLVEYSHILPPS